jgi:Chaperone of endosialidase
MASMPRGGGGGPSFAGRGGGGGMAARGGGGFGGGGRGGGGGRRSDIALKHDIVLLGHLASGLGYYRFAYNGSDKAYVGVMAQEVQQVMPDAVTRGSDGYLRVYYEKLGLTFRTYRDWLAGGAKIPAEVMP